MDMYNKPNNSKRRICTTVEGENTKLKWLPELKHQTYSTALIENSIKRALQIPLNKLRKPIEKEQKNNNLPLYSQSQ